MLERPDDNRTPATRISDADRNRAIDLLREHTGEGLLTLDEFSERVGLVYEARTRGDLEAVMSDLPTMHEEVPETRRRKVSRWAVAILGGHAPVGRIRLADRTNAIAILGGCELDLRNAEIDGREIEINAFALMGGVDIIVPEGIPVDFSGIPFMGGTECKVNPDAPMIPGAPRIVIRALAIMGGVTVQSRKSPQEERALRAERRADRRRRLEERHADRLARRAGRIEDHLRRHVDDDVAAQVRDRIDDALDRALPPSAPAQSRRPSRAGAGGQSRSRSRSRSIEAVAEAVEREWPEIRARAAPDGTVTIMFSDIEGYTEITERLGDHQSREVLRRHNEIIRRHVADQGGFEVKSQGDGFMIAFGGASRALRCAAAIQRDLEDYNARHPDEPLRVRMGLHTGEAIRESDAAGTDFLGRCVILASRIANGAQGGEVVVSSVLRELTAATGEFHFDDKREVELKGVSEPQTIWTLVWDR